MTQELKSRLINLNQIVGLSEIKNEFYESLAVRLSTSTAYKEYRSKRGIVKAESILMYSLPGIGKTYTLRQIQKSLSDHPDIDVIYKDSSEFQGQQGTNAKKIIKIFDDARATKKKICVLLLDEIDGIVMAKKGMLNVSERTNAFLSELDGMKDNYNLLVLATTNRINNIEKAILDRFKVIRINAPSDIERELLIKMYLSDIKFDKEIEIKQIINATEGFTGRNFASIGDDLIREQTIRNQVLPLSRLSEQISKYVQRAGYIKNGDD